MKKNKLLKTLAAIGILVTDSSCGKQDLETENPTLKNTSINQVFNESEFVPFTPITSINLDKNITNKIIAIARLSNDIFINPDIAEKFNTNPQKYLSLIGLSEVNLDLNSVEVKTALALGDKDIREALQANDLDKYLSLLETKKYIDFNSIKVDKEIADYLTKQFNSDPELKALINSSEAELAAAVVPIAAIAVAYAIAAVVSQAAAAYNLAVSLNAALAVNVVAWVNVSTQSSSDASASTSSISSSSATSSANFSTGYSTSTDLSYASASSTSSSFSITSSYGGGCGSCHYSMNSKANDDFANQFCDFKIFTNNPVLKIWGYEKNQNDLYVVSTLIERNVESITNLVENLEVYKTSKSKLKTEDLKTLLRKPITQKMIDLGLI